MTSSGWEELSADEILLALRSSPGSVSSFLDTHQWSPLREVCNVHFAGGHPAAQFRRAALGAEPKVTCWQFERIQLVPAVSSARQLRAHLYREGIEDAALGDIMIGDAVAVATIPGLELSDYIPGAVRAKEWPPVEVPFERSTVSALRLDAMVAALFRVSRGEAQTAIEYGFVFLNFAPVPKRTTAVGAGDQLVFRTKGRIELVDCATTTRSGRIAVSFRRYPV